MKIDFVVTWVDMNDPIWKENFAKYAGKIDNSKNEVSVARFRDCGFFKYWFRGVEKFTPWVNKIHLVTSGQIPMWLDPDNPKINLVKHEDYIPKEFLPCFNSAVIERFMHKIPDLTEQFVYFNDDFFIINNIEQSRFFQNGLPCDIAAFQYHLSIGQWYKRIKNNIVLINRYFDKHEVMKKHGEKWYNKVYGKKARLNYLLKHYSKFITLCVPHNAQPYLKSTFEDIWQECEKELTAASYNRLRCKTDYTPELIRTWQICRGTFEPYNTYKDTKMFPLVLKSANAIKAIKEQSYSLICLNDNVHIRNYARTMLKLFDAFDSIFPEKSSFEF